TGGDGNDTVEGGDGTDTLSGDFGADVWRRGRGNECVWGGPENGAVDILDGGAGFDYVEFGFESVGITVDLVEGIVHAGGDDGDILINIEELDGGSGNDVFSGDANDNWLNSRGGNDTLRGRGGNDQLWGGFGSDTYLYASGDGNDLILDQHDTSNPSELNTLQFTNIASNGVTLTQSGLDVLVNVLATGDTITIRGQVNPSGALGVERMVFSNGTTWDRSTIA